MIRAMGIEGHTRLTREMRLVLAEHDLVVPADPTVDDFGEIAAAAVGGVGSGCRSLEG